jgi:septum formation inhibitor-activating ATPase MinD
MPVIAQEEQWGKIVVDSPHGAEDGWRKAIMIISEF